MYDPFEGVELLERAVITGTIDHYVTQGEGGVVVNWSNIVSIRPIDDTPSERIFLSIIERLAELGILTEEKRGSFELYTQDSSFFAGQVLGGALPISRGYYFTSLEHAESFKQAKYSHAEYTVDIRQLTK